MVSTVSPFVIDVGALEAVEASTTNPGDDLPSHATANSNAIQDIVLVEEPLGTVSLRLRILLLLLCETDAIVVIFDDACCR